MKRPSFICGAAAAFVGLASVAPALAQARGFALDDVFAFKSVRDLRVSPDAKLVVFTVRWTELRENRNASDLWVAAIDGSQPPRPLTFDAASDLSPRWSPDGRMVAFLSDRGGTRQVWGMAASGGEARPLTAHTEAVTAFSWAPDGKRILIVARAPETDDEARRRAEKDDGYLAGQQRRNDRLWVAEVGDDPDRSLEPLTDGRVNVQANAAWSPDGARIALVASPTPEADSSADRKAQVLDVASRQIADVPGGDLASDVAWSPDGRTLAFSRAFDGRGLSREDLYVWTMGEAAARDVSSALDRDIEELWWTRDGRAVEALISRGAASAIARAGVERPGGVETLWTPGFTMSAVARAGDGWIFVRGDQPHDVWLAGRSGDPRRITALNQAAAGILLPTAEIVRWKGPAGEVEGVLIKPSGFQSSRRYPVIVNPHGGPRGRSTLDFDPVSCYFAAQGYVVLKPNFRGSTGYGDAFTKGNVANWGDGPFRDVMAGVDALVAGGVADPGRLFMYGWSYGGYLTNWTITHTDRFRAAVSGAGVADLRMQYTISDARRWRFDYFTGSPFAGNQPVYERESPITHIAGVKVPTLFIHGEKDERCPLPQGLMMYRALKDRGIETGLLVYPREGHGFTEPRHILDRARRVVEWFRKFDRAGASSAGL